MDQSTWKTILAIGVLLNSALYLAACITIGVVMHNGAAWKVGLASVGITYFSYICKCAEPDEPWTTVAPWLVWLSIILGAAAGVVLLFG